jgi:multicomponent K+:H+ antiporter subunit A
VTPYYEAVAKPLTGATDIVGAIVVDFRALDTLIEITVFSVAGLGIHTLFRYAARKLGDASHPLHKSPPPEQGHFFTRGIGGKRLSAFIRLPTYFTLPFAMVLAATQMMYGHDQPGDGFTAGVVIGLAIGLWYVVFGYEESRKRLPWLKGLPLIGVGILLAILNGTLTELIKGSFLANVDYGELVDLPLPAGFHISSSFLFELAICLAVLGSVMLILNGLGHPGYLDRESARRLQEISENERKETQSITVSVPDGKGQSGPA